MIHSKKNLFKVFFKQFDYFGVHFNFHYKSKQDYHSATGGFIFLLFIILTMIYTIFNFIPFVKRKNVSIISYTTQLPKTDEVSLLNYSSMVSVGVNCEVLENKIEIYEMLSLEIKFVKIIKEEEGNFLKSKKEIQYQYCKKSSFYNEFNSTFEEQSLNNYFCTLNMNDTIQGVYGDSTFSYYEYTFYSKPGREEKLIETMTKGECLLQLYYIDVGIDIHNFKKPAKKFITNRFIPLKPDSLIKMNLFFELNSFNSYEGLLFNDKKSNYYLGFSHIDEYHVFKGLNRFESIPIDYNIFSKIYIRVNDQRNIIQRNYMKFNEFLANLSSLISQVFICLFIFIKHMNYFFANKSLIKKIFKFKEELRGSKKYKCEYKNDFKNIILETNSYFKSESKLQSESEIPIILNNCQSLKKLNTMIDISFNPKIKSSFAVTNIDLNEEIPQKRVKFNTFLKKHGRKLSFSSFHTKQIKFRNDTYPFYYNLAEILFLFLVPCIKWQKLRKKLIFLSRCNIIVISQLDILNYLKHLQLLELLNYTLFTKNELNILDFLSNPFVSFANKMENKNLQTFSYTEKINPKTINDFYSSLQSVLSNQNKAKITENLCKVTNSQLKQFIDYQEKQKKIINNTITTTLL